MIGLSWLGAIIVGGFAGWIAGMIMKANNGLILNIIIGILGAVLGNFIAVAIVGSTLIGTFGQLAAGILGACLLIALSRLFR